MAEDEVPDSGFMAGRVRGLYERFAALIRFERASILASYRQSLETSRGPAANDDGAQGHMLASGSELIADLAERMLPGESQLEIRGRVPAWRMTETQASGQLCPAESLRAAVALFDATITSLAHHVENDPELLPCFVTAVLALNESLTMRTGEAAVAYAQDLLNRIDQAPLDERRRIARELHDRLGEGLSVALRQLELNELIAPGQPHGPTPQATLAREALVETMRRLRVLTSDLRQDPVTSLEKALTHYLDTVVADADIRLRVSGDERCATPTVIDEAYLIIREAIRNALAHAAPRLVLIEVDVDQHQLSARVKDDGCGFVPVPVTGGNGGLACMRERAILLAGRLTVSSVPGHGTCVFLVVPLPGPVNDQSR